MSWILPHSLNRCIALFFKYLFLRDKWTWRGIIFLSCLHIFYWVKFLIVFICVKAHILTTEPKRCQLEAHGPLMSAPGLIWTLEINSLWCIVMSAQPCVRNLGQGVVVLGQVTSSAWPPVSSTSLRHVSALTLYLLRPEFNQSQIGYLSWHYRFATG